MISFLSLSFAFGLGLAAPPQDPINVLVLLADDQRPDSIFGPAAAQYPTPHLDRLRERGTSFTRAVCAGSFSGAVCAPSRAMLLSGKGLAEFVESPFNPKSEVRLLPEDFRNRGYATFGTGKWHSGPSWFARCFSAGDAIFFGGMGPHVGLKIRPFDPSGVYPKEAMFREEGFSSEVFANSVIEFLQNRPANQPFFAWVSFTAPHDPRTPPEGWAPDPATVQLPSNFLTQHPFDNGEMVVRDEKLAATPRDPAEVRQHLADYIGMISHMDAQIGRIFQTLDETGATERTLVVFAADHGLAIGSHGLMGKQNLYQHSMGAPLIFAGPGIPQGKERDALAYLHDLYPTVAELAGIPGPVLRGAQDGRSLVTAIHGLAEVRSEQFTAYRRVQRAVTEERWKLIDYPVVGERQLFDLQEDPDEIHNLAETPKHQETLLRLREKLNRLEKESGIPLARPRRPNILFVYSDDHSAAAVSAYNDTLIQTPHLDRLAAQGLRFNNAFCTNALCGPARAVVLTGQHSHINGFLDNRSSFDAERITFPKLLQNAGYQTAVVGKWHLKSDPQGFDHWEVLPGQGHYYAPDFKTPAGKVKYPGYNTDIVVDRTLDWLENGRDPEKPFLMMCQFKAPHRPWLPGPEEVGLFDDHSIPEPVTLLDDASGLGTAARQQEMTIARHMWLSYDLKVPPLVSDVLTGPDKWSQGRFDRFSETERALWFAHYGPRNEKFRDANLEGDDLVRWKYQRYLKDYLRCIQGIDRNIGRLMSWLDEQGLSQDTIVVYSSDQGFFLGEHGWYDKRFMYEPSLKVPLIVRWPGVTGRGGVRDELVQNLDFAPTFLALAGIQAPEWMQGNSLLPILRGHGTPAWRQSIYYEYFGEPTHNVAAHYGVRTPDWKLIRYPDLDEWELFDLKNDPDEIHSLHGDPAHQAKRQELEVELKKLRVDYAVNSPSSD